MKYCLKINGDRIEGVDHPKGGIKSFFENHFSRKKWNRPLIGSMNINRLVDSANDRLVAPFLDEEIRNAV